MDLIIQFLSKGILPEDKSEAEKVRRKAPRFWLSKDQKLYKHSFSRPYLLCIYPKASELLLEELHEGICGSHIGGRSIAHRAITQGYWWPNTHQPRGFLNPFSNPWPFAQWGLDIVSSFPKAAGNKKYLLVSTNYFTKWVKTEPLANIRDVDVKKFV